MDIKGRAASAPLLGNFNLLIDMEVDFEGREEDVPGLLLEVVLLGDVLIMEVPRSSVRQGVRVVRVFRSECLTEVGVEQL